MVAHGLGYLTSVELRILAGISEATEVAWRKRRTGPAYVLFGTQYLYPKGAVLEFLALRLTAPHATPGAKAL